MKRRGVCYDVGAVTDMDGRPDFDPRIVRRELEIIRDDLPCNAVRITARDLKRLGRPTLPVAPMTKIRLIVSTCSGRVVTHRRVGPDCTL